MASDDSWTWMRDMVCKITLGQCRLRRTRPDFWAKTVAAIRKDLVRKHGPAEADRMVAKMLAGMDELTSKPFAAKGLTSGSRSRVEGDSRSGANQVRYHFGPSGHKRVKAFCQSASAFRP